MLLTERLLTEIEPSAIEQLKTALALPGLERAVVTADVHTGYAVPIGFTAVSASHLYPDTVGPDPACSVSLSRVPFREFAALRKPARRAIVDDFEAAIGVSSRHRRSPTPPAISFEQLLEILHGHHRRAKTWIKAQPRIGEWATTEQLTAFEAILREVTTEKMLRQVGSIGGGNHFLEVQLGDEGELYVMAHFGSRGLGAAGANYFFDRIRGKMATDLGRSIGQEELLFVEAGEPLGVLYRLFQQAMLEYATFSHLKVQDTATEVLRRHLRVADSEFLGHIPHNFIELRGGRFWQRKGATPAYDNDGIPLLIPGSMATSSYVLAPGPNASRLGESVPHGAGRVLSRGEARRSLDQAVIDRQFDERGVMANFRHVPLDESHAAYKDVDEVIKAVLVPGVAVVVNRLRPVLVLKGE